MAKGKKKNIEIETPETKAEETVAQEASEVEAKAETGDAPEKTEEADAEAETTGTKEPEAAEEVIEAAVSLTARRHPDWEFAVDVPGELVLVPMDARLVEQVLLNLLDNAVRHTETGSEIGVSLTTDREAGQAVFTVSDRGSGIAEADLPHIFQAFYTDAAGDSESARSMGLGLAICETVVKAHGGVISARNRTDGPGAEFTFTIPMEDQNG